MIYDNTPPLAFHYSVCRTWLLFKLFGHTHVSILHGGLAAWIEAGQSVTDKIPEFIKSEYEATLNEKLSRSYEDIVRNSKSQTRSFSSSMLEEVLVSTLEAYPVQKIFHFQIFTMTMGALKTSNKLR